LTDDRLQPIESLNHHPTCAPVAFAIISTERIALQVSTVTPLTVEVIEQGKNVASPEDCELTVTTPVGDTETKSMVPIQAYVAAEETEAVLNPTSTAKTLEISLITLLLSELNHLADRVDSSDLRREQRISPDVSATH
jgi:hypothetical protein